MLAELAGELSNSATYPTTFGNVQRKDLLLISGRYGVTWTPWSYDKRIRDAHKVSDFKKKVTDRPKVTQFIACLKSRQEHIPLIGKYVDFATKPEPLHAKNNACQQLNKAIFKEAMALTDPKVLSKVTTVTDLPENAPLARYFTALKTQVKAGKLYQCVARWFAEHRKAGSDLDVRFTGEDSLNFCQNFTHLLTAVMPNSEEHTAKSLLKVAVLTFVGNRLRKCVALFSKFKLAQDELEELETCAREYFNCNALFLHCTRTQWLIGYVIPTCTQELVDKYGYGLGLNTHRV